MGSARGRENGGGFDEWGWLQQQRPPSAAATQCFEQAQPTRRRRTSKCPRAQWMRCAAVGSDCELASHGRWCGGRRVLSLGDVGALPAMEHSIRCRRRLRLVLLTATPQASESFHAGHTAPPLHHTALYRWKHSSRPAPSISTLRYIHNLLSPTRLISCPIAAPRVAGHVFSLSLRLIVARAGLTTSSTPRRSSDRAPLRPLRTLHHSRQSMSRGGKLAPEVNR